MSGRRPGATPGALAAASAWYVVSTMAAFAAQAPVEDIRDIRGPRPIDSNELTWILVGAGVAALLLAYVLRKWIKRRRKAPETPDYQLALQRLDAARALMQSGGGREFSIEVSAVVREFIERRFHVMAAHRTTHEFLHDIVQSADSGLASHRDLLGEFLQSCDLAKFGGWNLTLEQMSSMLESARRFIQAAAAPVPADGAADGSGVNAASDKSHVSLPST
jgi:hypothetical protein